MRKTLNQNEVENLRLKNELVDEKEYFTTILTHYLRTPVRAQITALELLLNEKFGVVNREQKAILRHLVISNQQIGNMAENILFKYKTDGGRILIQKEQCDIRKILNEVLDKLQYIIYQKGQTVVVKTGFLSLNVEVDINEISKVFSNLILNALDHSRKNSEIKISMNNKCGFIEIEIEDNGHGIKKVSSCAFKNGFLDTAKFRKIGSGLGLYICKKIIEAHGGDIFIKKTDKNGTNIAFTLPSDF